MKPNLGDVLADKYRLDGVVGEGGMSMVFAATNTLTGKQVAIKWLLPELVGDEENSQRLLREAQATSAIDHPNVVNVFDIGRHGGALFLVMEHLHGEPLSEFLTRGPHDPVEFVQLMMPILRGVQAAHRMGIVHRDLKPDNIFLCRDPHGEAREPKVLDFGISKITGDLLEPGAELTRDGTVFGTPQYMAPEQLRDAHGADARSDIYALGVIFYRAFSNEYPYDADTLTTLAIRIVEGNAAPLQEICPHLDLGLCEVVMRALALDPERRFVSVAEFAQALEPFADGVMFVPPTRESWPSLRDSQTVLRASLTPQRISQPQLSQRHRVPSLVTGRTSAPQPPPAARLTSPPPAARLTSAVETELGDDDLTIVDPRFKIPPPHVLVGPRPSRGLDGEAQRVLPTERFPRQMKSGRKFALGAALFAVGALAPLLYQSINDPREPHTIAAPALKSGTMRKAEHAALPGSVGLSSTRAPSAPAPYSPQLTYDGVPGHDGELHPVTQQLAPVPQGVEPPAPSYVSADQTVQAEQTSEHTRRRRAGRRSAAAAALSARAASDAEANSQLAETSPQTRDEDPGVTLETERNPYLRR